MSEQIIKISNDYTKTPGGRYMKYGSFSGEDFREKILAPAFKKMLKEDGKLTVNLDGGYGYPPSFLEESFGGLARQLKDKRILDIKIISEEEPELVLKIKSYIEDALGAKK